MIPRSIRSLIPTSLAMSALLRFSSIAAAETDSERAARLYQQGNAAVEQKNWTEAEAAYGEAWKLAHTFDVAANLGLVELRLGNHRAAAELLAYSMRMAPPSSKPAQRQRTQQLFDEAKVKVGTVRVKLNVPGASVLVDGARIEGDDVQHELFVDPGRHVIEAGSAGYQVARTPFEVSAGEAKDVALTLVPVVPERRSMVPAFVMGGVGVAALGVGIATTVVSNAKSADANAQRTAILNSGGQCVQPGSFAAACSTMKNTLKALDTTADVAHVAYVAAGVLAIGAVTYALLPAPKPVKTGGARVVPMVGLNGGGMALAGEW